MLEYEYGSVEMFHLEVLVREPTQDHDNSKTKITTTRS